MPHQLYSVTRRARYLFNQFLDVSQSLRPPLSDIEEQRSTRLLLETANTWQTLMRKYYLVSATGGYLSSGARVNGPGVMHSINDALDAAVFLFQPRALKPPSGWTHRQEPNWLDPNIVARALANLSLSNYLGFTRALAASTGSYQPIYTCRNFVAHRNRETALKVRSLVRKYGVAPRADPSELPHLPAVGRPQSLISDWIDELIVVVEELPQ